jgi:hypothetical protein
MLVACNPPLLAKPRKHKQLASAPARCSQSSKSPSEKHRPDATTATLKPRQIVWRAGIFPTVRQRQTFRRSRSGGDSDALPTPAWHPLLLNVGGIRDDSFQTYPIEVDYLVRWAVDQCTLSPVPSLQA